VNWCPGRGSNRVSPEFTRSKPYRLGQLFGVWSSSSTEVTFNRHAVWNVEIPLCLIRCMESEGLGTCWGVGDCGPQSWSGHTYEGKRTPPPHQESNPIVTLQPFTLLTELSRFLSWTVYVVMRGAGNYLVSFNRLRAGFIYILHLFCTYLSRSVNFVLVGSAQPNVFVSLELRGKNN